MEIVFIPIFQVYDQIFSQRLVSFNQDYAMGTLFMNTLLMDKLLTSKLLTSKLLPDKLFTSLISVSFFLLAGISTTKAEIVTLEVNSENVDQSNTIQSEGVQATLVYVKQISEYGDFDAVPTLTVSGGGATIQTTGAISIFPYSLVQIVEMDLSNDLPEVLFSSFTGGAHCCDAVKILTHNPQTSTWEMVDAGYFDGGLNGVADPDQSGVYEYVTNDNRFLYKYSSYAGSFPPIQVWQLDGSVLRNVSQEPRFFPLHRARLQEMWRAIQSASQNGYEVNGVLAGYVATKMILGETIPAWELMLKRHDKNYAWGFEECHGTYNDWGECVGEWVTYYSFPEALRAFLMETGYLSTEDLAPEH